MRPPPLSAKEEPGKVSIALLFKKNVQMSNNLDAPNTKYVKLMKWTLNRINYYYKTLYINQHYLSTDT